jgi:hypothetical protein
MSGFQKNERAAQWQALTQTRPKANRENRCLNSYDALRFGFQTLDRLVMPRSRKEALIAANLRCLHAGVVASKCELTPIVVPSRMFNTCTLCAHLASTKVRSEDKLPYAFSGTRAASRLLLNSCAKPWLTSRCSASSARTAITTSRKRAFWGKCQ